jgi:hypothetical protein
MTSATLVCSVSRTATNMRLLPHLHKLLGI